jgi:hypothetical protein
MFNLEQSITEWRRQMLAAGIKTPVPLDELESHLRDEIERQVRAGVPAAAAFPSAVGQIGTAPAVQTEFQKVAAPNAARQWRMTQLWWFGGPGLAVLAWSGVVFFNPVMTPDQRISGWAAGAVLLLLIAGGRLGCGLLPVIPDRRIRAAIGLTGCLPIILWVYVLTYLVLPRCDSGIGEFVVRLMWGFLTPFGILNGLAFGLEAAARKETGRPAR